MKNEIQRGLQKGHRVVIKRDLRDGKAISYEVAEFLSVSDFEALQVEVAQKQKQLAEEQRELDAKQKKLEEERITQENLRKQKQEEEMAEQRLKEKFSIKNFAIAHNAMQHKILVGLIEDDGSFPLLLDQVLNKELTVQEALDLSSDLKTIFNQIFGGNE